MFQLFSTFDFAIKKSQGHHFNNFGITKVLEATYHVSKPLLNWFRRRFLNISIIDKCGSHLHGIWFQIPQQFLRKKKDLSLKTE